MTNEHLQTIESRRSKFDVQALVDEVRRLQTENAALKADQARPAQVPKPPIKKDAKE
jgi:hypothetical protein